MGLFEEWLRVKQERGGGGASAKVRVCKHEHVRVRVHEKAWLFNAHVIRTQVIWPTPDPRP
eukprot:scaffold217008_cov18-Tisochrysis_lutea.AAC.2